MINRFASNQDIWSKVIWCVAELDALISLALAAEQASAWGPICLPEFLACSPGEPQVWAERAAIQSCNGTTIHRLIRRCSYWKWRDTTQFLILNILLCPFDRCCCGQTSNTFFGCTQPVGPLRSILGTVVCEDIESYQDSESHHEIYRCLRLRISDIPECLKGILCQMT